MNTKRLTELSLLTAIALIIFIVELRIPNLSPISGVKLGLANIITVYAVYKFKAKEVAMLIFTRILLGSIFSGNPSALIYSCSGALFCLLGMLAMRKIIPENKIWLSSVVGAIFHNTGQIIAAICVMKSFSVITYYPFLIVTGIIAGYFTGLTAQFILQRKLKQSDHY